MFKKILIANRGEIALRIMHTCRNMGIKTVAIYSDADQKAAHVIFADEAVYIGKSEPSLSYLNMDRIIKAAKDTQASAIHPGYGFCSENYEFAEKCHNKGIIFIGPRASVIKNLGNKIIARNIMINNGIAVIPGLSSCETDILILTKTAEKIGYPVLIKAAKGGGGKGICIVNSSKEIKEAVKSASRQAKKAFGNGDVYIEKFFTQIRHIEFQILGDQFGNIIHLMERECSIQRRHQKIIEETPCIALTPALRNKMGNAAIKAAKVSNYENAGTVEFLLDKNNNFYFLEINTRLQVEHPITEMTTGIDIVKHQIKIAAGLKLSLKQKDIKPHGHALECRIYAEDPELNFAPCPGKIKFIKEPKGPGIRNDSGIYKGFEVPIDYDPILAKLVVHGETRNAAISKMINALKDYIILGIKTPIEFMIDILNSKSFKNNDVFTDFIETHFPNWEKNMELSDMAMIAFVIHSLTQQKNDFTLKSLTSKTVSPWNTLGKWEIA